LLLSIEISASMHVANYVALEGDSSAFSDDSAF